MVFRNLPFKQRSLLFLGVCIPFRILLGLSLWFIMDKDDTVPEAKEVERFRKAVLGFIVVTSLLSAVVLSVLVTSDDAWWSRPFELFVVIMMFILSAFVVFPGEMEAKYLAVPLWIDVAVGLMIYIQSFWV